MSDTRMIDINKLIEMVEASRESIYIGTDTYGEPNCIDVINANIFVLLLKKELGEEEEEEEEED